MEFRSHNGRDDGGIYLVYGAHDRLEVGICGLDVNTPVLILNQDAIPTRSEFR